MTSPPWLDAATDDEQIVEIVQQVWGSYAEIALEPVPREPAGPGGDVLTGTVRITGAWDGRVALACPVPVARAAAAAMLGVAEHGLTAADVADAVGELTNVIGGNVKSLLPAPSELSLPAVGVLPDLPHPGAVLLHDVLLRGALGPVAVSVWQQP